MAATSLSAIDSLIKKLMSIEKEKENEASCKSDDVIDKSEFPFSAAKSVENFDMFVNDNSHKGRDYIKLLHDKRGMNLLHCACVNDCDELIEILVSKYHISVNEVDVDGYSPLFYCVNQWSEECVEKLLLFNPRLDIVTRDCVIHATGFPIYICGGKTVFHQAAETNSTSCCELILEYLKSFHSDTMIDVLFKKDFNLFTAMDTAKMYNKMDMVKLLNQFIRSNIKNDDPRIDLLNYDVPNQEERKQLKREYHLKIRERVKQRKQNEEKMQQQNIAKHYKPRYQKLFFQTDKEYFPLHLLDKTLLKLVKELNGMNNIQQKWKVVEKYKNEPVNFLKEPLKGIWTFRVFGEHLCDLLLEESENYIKESLHSANSGLLPITRPNSMNSYGLVLNAIGMRESFNCFVNEIIKPLSDVLIPSREFKQRGREKKDEEETKVDNDWCFKSHHTFMIRYKQGEDIQLNTHIDASAVTLNVCIGNKPGFKGAHVYFHSLASSEEDKEQNEYAGPHPSVCKHCRYELFHQIGYGVLHVGNFIHGTKPLTKGIRSNVVIWCKEYMQ